jgi:hypothetical protein
VQKINEVDLGFLRVCAVGGMLVCGMVGWERSRYVRRLDVDEPEASLWVTCTNDGCDAVLDDAGIASVEQDVITPVVAELTERDEGFAKIGLYEGSSETVVEGDGKVTEVQLGGV